MILIVSMLLTAHAKRFSAVSPVCGILILVSVFSNPNPGKYTMLNKPNSTLIFVLATPVWPLQ